MVKTVQKAADLAMQAGSRLYTDSASSYGLITGYEHDSVNHTKKEYARGEVHENRAEGLFSLLKPYLRVFRSMSKTNLPGYMGFFQFLHNFHQLTAFEQAKLILHAALDPSVASKARKGDFVKALDYLIVSLNCRDKFHQMVGRAAPAPVMCQGSEAARDRTTARSSSRRDLSAWPPWLV